MRFIIPGFALALGLVAIACDKPPAATTTPPAELAMEPAPSAPKPAEPPPAAHPSAPPPRRDLPPGHPPLTPPAGEPPRPAGPMAQAVPAESGVARPLPLEGSGSVAELRARLAKVKDTSKHATLEDAFRRVFTVTRPERDIAGAESLLTPLASDADPAVAALAERTLGYVRVSAGFDAEGAKARYARAIELDPEYGEAHYAMAFMYAMGDREKGKVHFEKAMSLGVPDTRGLRGQFFGP
jgi:hypothetical protein